MVKFRFEMHGWTDRQNISALFELPLRSKKLLHFRRSHKLCNAMLPLRGLKPYLGLNLIDPSPAPTLSCTGPDQVTKETARVLVVWPQRNRGSQKLFVQTGMGSTASSQGANWLRAYMRSSSCLAIIQHLF